MTEESALVEKLAPAYDVTKQMKNQLLDDSLSIIICGVT